MMNPAIEPLLNLSTHPVGEDTCRAIMSRQWLLEKRDAPNDHPISTNNHLDFLICAAEAFPRIVTDMENAKKTVDIICFGFDPGMEVGVRSGGTWPRGLTYGDLLLKIADKGVIVRLLVWFSEGSDIPAWAGRKANNLRGHPDFGGGVIKNDSNYERALYCNNWWGKAMGGYPNLHVRHRKVAPINTLKTVGPSELTLIEKEGLELVATHHQKPILIDYENPDHAVGYVMGLNSLTDYWDTQNHVYNDQLRGHSYEGEADSDNPTLGLKPYRDYAMRIEGKALIGLNRNFVTAWDAASTNWNPNRNSPGIPAHLKAHRQPLDSLPFTPPSGTNCEKAQILRTDPESSEQTIQDIYWLATNQARNYIYIENQYFQNQAWAETLKARREIYREGLKECGGLAPKAIPPLYVFIVIPQPERSGMVPRTYDTIAALGQGDKMENYDGLVKLRRDLNVNSNDSNFTKILKAATTKLAKPLDATLLAGIKDSASKPSVTQADLEKMGIKVLVAMLQTQDAITKKCREIYIHSKLMIVDDAFLTLGSANLNIRSMCSDGEINIAIADKTIPAAARHRVWTNIAGGDLDGGDMGTAAMKKNHEGWIRKMKANAKAIKNGEDIKGFIVTFSDTRTATLSPRTASIPTTANEADA